MDMQLLVQKKDKLDAEKAIKFIEKCKNAKLAIVHSSIRDEVVLLDFLEHLVRNLKTPFVGTRVSGTVTPNEGYCEDVVAIVVLCGNFDVNVFHESIDFQNPEKTTERAIPHLNGCGLCFVYSANHYKQNVVLDAILRGVQNSYPKLQIMGAASSPPALVAINDGIYDDHLVLVALNRINFDFVVDSGFRFDENYNDKFAITKSDEYHVYEINNKDALDEYSKIQHLRPYFLNMITKYVLTRPDIANILTILSKTSKVMYRGLVRIGINVLGSEVKGGLIEPAFVLELNEGDKRYVLMQSYRPVGTLLKRLKTSSQDQLAIYDRLYVKSKAANSMFVLSCAAVPIWIDFDFKALEKKFKRFKCPFLLSYVFGEFGAKLPYEGIEQNVVHGGVVKALIFK